MGLVHARRRMPLRTREQTRAQTKLQVSFPCTEHPRFLGYSVRSLMVFWSW